MKSHKKYTGSRLQQAKQVSRLAYEQSFSILPFITKHTTLSFIIRLNHKITEGHLVVVSGNRNLFNIDVNQNCVLFSRKDLCYSWMLVVTYLCISRTKCNLECLPVATQEGQHFVQLFARNTIIKTYTAAKIVL